MEQATGLRMSGLVRDNIPVAAKGAAGKRVFIFLQGPISPLFRQVGRRLRKMGHEVYRVNLCAGDVWGWPGKGTFWFRGKPRQWKAWCAALMAQLGVTDLVVHSDQRFYHRVAIREARKQSVFVSVTELGMLRPSFLTLEADGLGPNSWLPNCPKEIEALAAKLPDTKHKEHFKTSFFLVAAPDVFYNLLNIALVPLFPHYRRHTLYHPIREYLGFLARSLRKSSRERDTFSALEAVSQSKYGHYLFPLQLEGDFQIRKNSPFSGQLEALEKVVSSFSKFSHQNSQLVVKSHPLDTGAIDWSERLEVLANKYAVSGRVHLVDCGLLSQFFEGCRGVVTINSTAGIEALQADLPVKCMGMALYDLKRLTFQEELDDFWANGRTPEKPTLLAFQKVLEFGSQVHGSIYNRRGLKIAGRNIALKLSDLSYLLLPEEDRLPPRRRVLNAVVEPAYEF
ncbi:capsular biosynthesis protein [Rhodobacteraceae bacterium RKSG542]|uniref:capsule biosynthesis protein n=1 Tax=Pseudovibrio flavus TaxID=2529854 RepID=UPI0012BBEDB3|nr:capsular biosynthesis protein [Pseudovibrio flavus]MTI16952.1 capsular biosynthesis protein [Pseudovibrio flavus]